VIFTPLRLLALRLADSSELWRGIDLAVVVRLPEAASFL
jgi:hypothetical protein